jgi:phosphohistidine swiveling domain-containing protein
MPGYPNSHRSLRPELGEGANPDEILSLIDQSVDHYSRTSLVDGRSNRYLIKGAPVSSGVAVGQAVVVQSPEDLQRIRPDSILICSRMAPVYSIAFPVVRGIISERSGIMSTAATVARENGLPVVTRVRSARRIISDGDLIKINGTDGSVQIVSKHRPEV